jgi:hypothetical protein
MNEFEKTILENQVMILSALSFSIEHTIYAQRILYPYPKKMADIKNQIKKTEELLHNNPPLQEGISR